MKKVLTYFLALSLILILLVGCQAQETLPEEPEGQVLEATVLEIIGQDQLLVEPVAGSPELSSADRIIAHTSETVVLDEEGEETTIESYELGSVVQITYDGSIAESYPAQIWAEKVQPVN